MLDRITPLILTLNEAPNLERTLARLAWAKEIVVLDSGSTDKTREILDRHRNVRVCERPFSTHTEQWNYGLVQTGIATQWVLALDADFVLTEALVRELSALDPADDVSGYRAAFSYCIGGVPLRSAIYPPVAVLYRRANARYVQDGHTQRVELPGRIEPLVARIFHDDRKSLACWYASQLRYMRLEAEKLRASPISDLSWPDRVRRLVVVAPLLMFFYCLIVRGNLLDGWRGVYYALQRATAEAILSVQLLRTGIGKGNGKPG